jgi:hypothetical protein
VLMHMLLLCVLVLAAAGVCLRQGIAGRVRSRVRRRRSSCSWMRRLIGPPSACGPAPSAWVRVLRHLDADDTAERVRQVYTVILYLTTGAQSTAFPTFKSAEFALPRFASERADAAVLNAADMQRTAALGLLDDSQYASWPVEAGDMALFSQATMVRWSAGGARVLRGCCAGAARV